MPEENNKQRPKEIYPEDLIRECVQSQGSVICIGILTNRKDPNGVPIIDYKYLRRGFLGVDLPQAREKFNKMIQEDWNNLKNAGGVEP
jgi:hypothetical protein